MKTTITACACALMMAFDAAAQQPAASECTGPEVRFYHWAWNSQMGMMLATGGKQATASSLMCKKGVNLKLIREDNTDAMAALLVTVAEGVKKGEANPSQGAHFVGIMGDGAATFLKGLNDRLGKLGACPAECSGTIST